MRQHVPSLLLLAVLVALVHCDEQTTGPVVAVYDDCMSSEVFSGSILTVLQLKDVCTCRQDYGPDNEEYCYTLQVVSSSQGRLKHYSSGCGTVQEDILLTSGQCVPETFYGSHVYHPSGLAVEHDHAVSPAMLAGLIVGGIALILVVVFAVLYVVRGRSAATPRPSELPVKKSAADAPDAPELDKVDYDAPPSYTDSVSA